MRPLALILLLCAGPASASGARDELDSSESLSRRGSASSRKETAAHNAGRAFAGTKRTAKVVSDSAPQVKDTGAYKPSTTGAPADTGGPVGAPQAGGESEVTPYQGRVDDLKSRLADAIAHLRRVARKLKPGWIFALATVMGTFVAVLLRRARDFKRTTDQPLQGEVFVKAAEEVRRYGDEMRSTFKAPRDDPGQRAEDAAAPPIDEAHDKLKPKLGGGE